MRRFAISGSRGLIADLCTSYEPSLLGPAHSGAPASLLGSVFATPACGILAPGDVWTATAFLSDTVHVPRCDGRPGQLPARPVSS